MDPLRKMAELEPTKKAFTLLEEFKNFALKGNVIDLAVGVIIGAAFGNLVSSLVKDLLTPLLTAIMPGDKSYEAWAIPVGGQEIKYGKFLGETINFLIVTLALFLFIQKFLGFMLRMRKQEAATPALTKEQELLTEIRDLLKARA